MTQTTTMRINNWAKFLLPVLLGLFGVWGTYNVLINRVGNLEVETKEMKDVAEVEKARVWARLVDDKDDRQLIKNDVRDMKHDLSDIQKSQKRTEESIEQINIMLKK